MQGGRMRQLMPRQMWNGVKRTHPARHRHVTAGGMPVAGTKKARRPQPAGMRCRVAGRLSVAELVTHEIFELQQFVTIACCLDKFCRLGCGIHAFACQLDVGLQLVAGHILYDRVGCHARVFVFDVEASDVGMEGNLLCDVGDTALLRGHETRKGFSQKGSARLVDVLDIRTVSDWYRRD